MNLVANSVRGPFFLAALSLLLLLAAVPAQAVLLQGYLDQSSSQVTAEGTPVSLSASAALPSFPSSFAGAWRCLTVVVDSAIATVEIGQQMESQVNFIRQPDGRIVGQWAQPGWTDSVTSIYTLSEREANTDRTNYYTRRQGWAARSQDNYIQLDDDRIAASSYVDQYVNGQYAGRYRTRSMLMRMPETGPNLALHHR